MSVEPRGLRRWIIEHDDSWLFVIAYIGLAVVLSIWISLFWLVAVVGAHFALEWMRQSHLVSPAATSIILPRVLWELKLDFALILFALVIGVYMEVILGAAGLSAATRIGLQSGARFAGWQRVLRGVLLSVDDAAQLGRAALMRANGGTVEEEVEAAEPIATPPTGWTGRWSWGDRLSIGFGAICIALLVVAPIITDHSLFSMIETMLHDLHPFPPTEPQP